MSRLDGDWIQTFTGRQFWPLDPRPEDVSIEDIAHALSNLCRFTGHVREFYSVADHCIRVSEIVAPEVRFWALMHDAPEAYLLDLARPLKHAAGLGEVYRECEARLMAVIAERFGLELPEPPAVKAADQVLLYTEKRDLMGRAPRPWADPVTALPGKIWPRSPKQAEEEFLQRFFALCPASVVEL